MAKTYIILEIAPCPFCGSGEGGSDYESIESTVGTVQVRCKKCGAYGPLAGCRELAIERWNARARSKKQVKRGF